MNRRLIAPGCWVLAAALVVRCGPSTPTTSTTSTPSATPAATRAPATTPAPSTTPPAASTETPQPPTTGNPPAPTESGTPGVELKASNVFLTDTGMKGARLALSPDGSRAVTTVEGAHLWDTAGGKELPWNDPETARSLKGSAGGVAYWPDGSHFWISIPQSLLAVNTKTHQIERSIPTDSADSPVVRLSSGMKYLATDEAVFDVQAKKKRFELLDKYESPREVDFGHDGKTLVGRWDKAITIWDLDTGQVAHRFDFKTDGVLPHQLLACSPTSDLFALIAKKGEDRVVEIHDLATGEVKGTFGQGLKLDEGNLAWSPDGKYLSVVVDLGIVQYRYQRPVWLLDATSGTPVASLAPAPTEVERVAFSGDGRKVAILAPNFDKDNKFDLMIWDLKQLSK